MAGKRRRWLALLVLCLGNLMVALGSTIVHVALPSLRAGLELSDTSLAWVVNIFMLTFGGFLLLAGRMGDIFGHRRLLLVGLTVFACASLAGGLAGSSVSLVAARAVQGLGGAIVSVVSLSLIMTLFTEPTARVKAMGVIGFFLVGGGSIGMLLGGVLTDALSWRWVFLVNVPIGVVIIVLCLVLVPTSAAQDDGRLDVAGSVTMTTALLIAAYAIMDGNHAGWNSTRTISLMVVAAALLGAFVRIETRAEAPLIPLDLFRTRSVTTANIVIVLSSAAMAGSAFLSTLYLQLVFGYSPLGLGLAFLPGNLIMAVFLLSLSDRIVLRYGIKASLITGILLMAAGFALFARAPADGTYAPDVLPAMILLGLGTGMAINPMLLAAMSDVAPSQSGLASGVANSSFMMGGALGLAVLASIANARTKSLAAANVNGLGALTGGYHAGFVVAAGLAAAAATLGFLLLPQDRPTKPSRFRLSANP